MKMHEIFSCRACLLRRAVMFSFLLFYLFIYSFSFPFFPSLCLGWVLDAEDKALKA